MAANAYNHHLLKNKTKPAILMMNKRKAARDNCQNGKSSIQWSAAYPLDIHCPDGFRSIGPRHRILNGWRFQLQHIANQGYNFAEHLKHFKKGINAPCIHAYQMQSTFVYLFLWSKLLVILLP